MSWPNESVSFSQSKRFAKQTPWWAVEHVRDSLDVRIYHVKTRLLDEHQVVGACQGAQRLSSDVLGLDLPPLAVVLLDIRGVAAIEVRAHHFVVRKAPLYDWEPIEEAILELLLGAKTAEQMEFAAAEGFADIARRRGRAG